MEMEERSQVPNGKIKSDDPSPENTDGAKPEYTADSDAISKISSQDSESEAKSEWDPNIPKPLDGGWGWMVVFASFMIHVVADGIVYSFGIFYSEFLEYFGSGKGDTAWIASLMVGITFVSGPVSSAFVNRLGCRFTTILGSIIGSCGFILSIFAPNIYVLYVTFGFLGGLGFGLIYVPAIVSVGQYFEKKRSFATGLAVCGSGVGTFVFAPLSQALVNYYGWKGATMILTGILLNCVLLGALFRPLYSENELKEQAKKRMEVRQKETLAAAKRHRDEKMNGQVALGTPEMLKEKKRLLNEDSLPNQQISSDDPRYFCSLPMMPSKESDSSPQLTVEAAENGRKPLMMTSDTQIDTIVKKRRGSAVHKHSHYHHMPTVVTPYSAYACKDTLDVPRMAFMSNHSLHVMSISTLHVPAHTEEDKSKSGCSALLVDFKSAVKEMTDFSLLKNPLFLMFAISNFFTSIGFNAPYIYLPDHAHLLHIPEQQSAFLISVIGIANTVGRVLFGFLSDRIGLYRLHLYNTALLLCGICTALSPLCVTYPWLAAYAASYGLFVGTYVTLTAILLVDLLGLENLVNSFGLLLLFQGLATLIGPPMLGWVFDATGSYQISFIIAGVMIALSGAMLYFIPCVDKIMKRNQAKREAKRENANRV